MKVFSSQKDRYDAFASQCMNFLGENMCFSLFSALFCYITHPEDWAYDDEGYDIFALLRALEDCGFNEILPDVYNQMVESLDHLRDQAHQHLIQSKGR